MPTSQTIKLDTIFISFPCHIFVIRVAFFVQNFICNFHISLFWHDSVSIIGIRFYNQKGNKKIGNIQRVVQAACDWSNADGVLLPLAVFIIQIDIGGQPGAPIHCFSYPGGVEGIGVFSRVQKCSKLWILGFPVCFRDLLATNLDPFSTLILSPLFHVILCVGVGTNP